MRIENYKIFIFAIRVYAAVNELSYAEDQIKALFKNYDKLKVSEEYLKHIESILNEIFEFQERNPNIRVFY